MLIMSPTEAALAIGAKCGGSAPNSEDQGLVMILRMMLGRLEAAMNVASLVRGNYVDHFYCTSMPRGQERPEQTLLLSNGFVVPGSVVITSPAGTTYVEDPDVPHYLNADEGYVRLARWERGVYSVAYSAGFDVEPAPIPVPPGYDPEDRVLKNVPDWLKAIAITFLISWYRAVMVAPRASKEISFSALEQALRREIFARVYGKYMRPRVAVTFSERMDRVA